MCYLKNKHTTGLSRRFTWTLIALAVISATLSRQFKSEMTKYFASFTTSSTIKTKAQGDYVPFGLGFCLGSH